MVIKKINTSKIIISNQLEFCVNNLEIAGENLLRPDYSINGDSELIEKNLKEIQKKLAEILKNFKELQRLDIEKKSFLNGINK